MIDIDNISVQLADLPARVHSFVHLSEEGEYTIFINARLNDVLRMKAYKHELRHIFNKDFESYCADQIEQRAHKVI